MFITNSQSIVVEALQALGNTADQVAAALRSKGIKGKRECSDACPIVKYINHYLSDKTKCRAGNCILNFYDTSFINRGRYMGSVGMTTPIATFIHKFDTGS